MLQQVTQVSVQLGPAYLCRRRLYNLSGHSVLVVYYPYYKEFLPHVSVELPVLNF